MSRCKILISAWMSYFMVLIATLIITPRIIIMSSNIIIIPPFNFLVIHGVLTGAIIGFLNTTFQFKEEDVTDYFRNEYIIVEEEGASDTPPNEIARYFNNILSTNKRHNNTFHLAYVITFLLIYLIVVLIYTLFSSTSTFVYLFIIDIFYHIFFLLRGVSNFRLRMNELKQIGKEISEH